MIAESFDNLLLIPLALGLLHALDSDHVVAVSLLSDRSAEPGRATHWYGLRWAIGHGATVLLLGTLALAAGQAIPDGFSIAAEVAVGIVMILMGLIVLYRGYARRPLVSVATPGGGAPAFRATAIGAMHGMAGSASIVAMIPVLSGESYWQGLLFLLVFGVGVLISMLLFGQVLDALIQGLGKAGENAVHRFRNLVSLASIVIGGLLILGSL